MNWRRLWCRLRRHSGHVELRFRERPSGRPPAEEYWECTRCGHTEPVVKPPTPCSKLGYKEGDLFYFKQARFAHMVKLALGPVLARSGHTLPDVQHPGEGALLMLNYDDGSEMPHFRILVATVKSSNDKYGYFPLDAVRPVVEEAPAGRKQGGGATGGQLHREETGDTETIVGKGATCNR